MPVVVRDAVEQDIPAVVAINNEVIATSTAVYIDAATTLEERHAWWRARPDAGYPVLVATDESGVVPGAVRYSFSPN